jgi:HEAT repeats
VTSRFASVAYAAGMTLEQQWVEALAIPLQRLDAMRSLIGGVNARELRSVVVSEDALQALIHGLRHQNSQVRWWCVQLLDHCSDSRAIDAVVAMLDDPVPRVRRNAAHALACTTCKPMWSGEPSERAVHRLEFMVESDPNSKVRDQARRALSVVSR